LSAPSQDIEALAKGGRTNVFGFLLRLAARIPFLVIAGRVYGADALGRVAYSMLVVEFAAQLATMGLRRGLALQLAQEGAEANHEAWDGLLLATIVAVPIIAVMMLFPQAMFPNSPIHGLELVMPLAALSIALTDIMLSALAFRFDVAATVRTRAVVEPWTISIGAWAFSYYSLRDGLLLSYGLSVAAGLVATIVPFVRSFGMPKRWRPQPAALAALTRRNLPLAAADAIEWASRRIDLAILGLFCAPATVGIYYVAQQVASLPQKLKTSFDPVLGPVIARNLADGDKAAVAKQISQVGFWIIAAQAGIALALGIPGEGVMGLLGPNFVGGTGALAFLLLAEVAAAAAVVSEAALIYIARNLNFLISGAMIAVQAGLSVVFILGFKSQGYNELYQAAGPAMALTVALGLGSLIKTRLAASLLGNRVSVWRWPLALAASAATLVGWIATKGPEWSELLFGIPAILGTYGWIIWKRGFGEEDRVLFRKSTNPS
jgi:O-antigen/teichoic acid export membrane protein